MNDQTWRDILQSQTGHTSFRELALSAKESTFLKEFSGSQAYGQQNPFDSHLQKRRLSVFENPFANADQCGSANPEFSDDFVVCDCNKNVRSTSIFGGVRGNMPHMEPHSFGTFKNHAIFEAQPFSGTTLTNANAFAPVSDASSVSLHFGQQNTSPVGSAPSVPDFHVTANADATISNDTTAANFTGAQCESLQSPIGHSVRKKYTLGKKLDTDRNWRGVPHSNGVPRASFRSRRKFHSFGKITDRSC
ncbi:MAG: hypothetical protein LBT64_00390 [Puniceicoccales bacterium]|jgi:hypothetical protein|nr:hypothetical protein [Puniceicoccales bacterium]